MRRGGALLMVLMIIAALSVIVLSFSYEANQQGGINTYVRERNRVARVITAGQAIAEVTLLNYKSAPAWNKDQDDEKLKEDHNIWILAQQDLNERNQCKIERMLLDDTRDKDGNLLNTATVSVEISLVNSGDKGIININQLYKGGGDSKYAERWWMIFKSHGIPEKLSTPKDGIVNLWNILIASWDDWRDEDDTVSSIDGEECGAENDWYEEYEEDNKIEDEDKKRPRNGPIPDVHELACVRGFRDYPQVLTGGVINPWERPEDQISVQGIEDLFCTEGTMKITIDPRTPVEALVTIPGIYEDASDDDCLADAFSVANLIKTGLTVMPEDTNDIDENREWWPYKDWNDLTDRVDEDIGSEASNYLMFPSKGSTDAVVFNVKIVGESMGMTRTVTAQCYVKEKEIRYIKWQED